MTGGRTLRGACGARQPSVELGHPHARCVGGERRLRDDQRERGVNCVILLHVPEYQVYHEPAVPMNRSEATAYATFCQRLVERAE